MLREIHRLKTEYVTGQELQEAKDKILGNILISLETNMDDAGLLGWYGALGYGINHLEEYKNEILNVTQSDILAVANKYFSKPYINVTIMDKAQAETQIKTQTKAQDKAKEAAQPAAKTGTNPPPAPSNKPAAVKTNTVTGKEK